MPEKKLKTLLEILNFSSDLLEKENISNARLNVELMLSEVLKCDRVRLYMDFDRPMLKDEVSLFKVLLKKRLNKEPLQYVLGKTNFYGYNFVVNKNVLIPRPDTEILVENILDDIKESGKKYVKIFEIGTGSGCISISLSKELSKKGIEHLIKAIDISDDVINVAKGNKDLNSVDDINVVFQKNNLFDIKSLNEKYDYIVSNPPYISKEEYDKLDDEIKYFEPKVSLSDDGDGLKFFKKLFDLFSNCNTGTKAFFEIGYDQKFELESLLERMSFKDFIFFEDYSKINRVLKINF